MKIKVNEKILNYEGKPLKVSTEDDTDLTWKMALTPLFCILPKLTVE